MLIILTRHLLFTDRRVIFQILNITALFCRRLNLIFVGPDESRSPVQFIRPYFDCGRSNKWLVAAVSPVADIYPRHTGFRHVEFPR